MSTVGIVFVWCLIQVTVVSMAGCSVAWLASKAGVGRLATIVALGMVLGLTFFAFSPWPNWFGQDQSLLAGPTDLEFSSSTGLSTAHDSTGATEMKMANSLSQSDGLLTAVYWRSLWNQLIRPPTAEVVSNVKWGTPWTTIILGVVLPAVTLGFLRFLLGVLFIRRLAHTSIPLDDSRLLLVVEQLSHPLGISEPVQFKQSNGLYTAATFGWRRPVVLLPAEWQQWPDGHLHAVLAHELAHVAQRDFIFGLIGQLTVAMHFYHPLVHWLARRLRLEQELAADAVAAQLTGGQERYLQSLAALTLHAERLPTSWVIQTFLPTRSLFVRRIEMLKRMRKMEPEVRTGRARLVVIGSLVAVGLAAVGLRGPGRMNAVQAEPQGLAEVTTVAAESGNAGYDFAYVPEPFTFLLAIRPAKMASSPHWAPYAQLLGNIIRPRISVEALEQVTLVLPLPKRTEAGHIIPGTGSEYTIFRTNRPVDFKQPLEATYGTITLEQHNAQPFMAWDTNPGRIAFHSPDTKTLLSTPRSQLFAAMDNPDASQSPAQAGHWCDETTGPILGVLQLEAARSLLATQNGSSLPGGYPLQMLSPLVQGIQQATFTVDLQEEMMLHVQATCSSSEQVSIIEQTVRSALVLLQNITASQKRVINDRKDKESSEMVQWLALADRMMKNVSLKSEGKILHLTAPLGDPKPILKMLIDSTSAAQQAARRTQSQNNLKQLALALLNYESAHGHYPPAVLYDQKTGIPYSWRVAILPYLEQKALHDRYHFDEPWDSEHNRQIARTVVPVYQAPTDPKSTNSSYYLLLGPETIFSDKDGVKITEVTDGTSNTLLVVEAKRAIPWTKPEDIVYTHDGPLPQLGGYSTGGFAGSFADGSVRFIPDDIEPEILRNLIEKADGNSVDRDSLR